MKRSGWSPHFIKKETTARTGLSPLLVFQWATSAHRDSQPGNAICKDTLHVQLTSWVQGQVAPQQCSLLARLLSPSTSTQSVVTQRISQSVASENPRCVLRTCFSLFLGWTDELEQALGCGERLWSAAVQCLCPGPFFSVTSSSPELIYSCQCRNWNSDAVGSHFCSSLRI